MKYRRALTALVLAIVSFVCVVVAQRSQGIVRDEVHYMNFGSRYAAWWSGYVSGEDGIGSEEQITAHFGGEAATANNREHPPLMKTLFGFSEQVFHRKLGWAGRTTAYRLPTAAMHALLVVLVFLFASGVWSFWTGVLSALLVLVLPRAFFHAGLATFDAPVVTVWFATIYAYYKSLASRWWSIGLGVVFGLALATKHNAIMLPAVVVSHYVWTSSQLFWKERARGVGGALRALGSGLLRAQPWAIPAMLLIGPVVLVALWPWLWFDTLEHLRQWLDFHFQHVHYNFEYLGENYNAPPFPWHIAVVTTLLTVPAVTLFAAAMGGSFLFERWRRGNNADDARGPTMLLLFSAAVAIGPFFLRTTPIFGAEKHWAAAIVSLCIFGGYGVFGVVRATTQRLIDARVFAERHRQKSMAVLGVCLGGLVLGASAAETVAAHPYSLSHYTAMAGGAPGGADIGMNRQFWGYSARGVLPYLNQYAPPDGAPPVYVYTHDASPAWGIYIRDGLLDRGLPDAGHEERGIRRSKLAIVVHERHFNRHDYLIWSSYKTVQPVFVLTARGVPIVSVYARPSTGSGPTF